MRQTNGVIATGVVCLLTLGNWPPAFADSASATNPAEKIVEASGIQGGLIVHVGCGDGRVTARFPANERYCIQGIDVDAADVMTARDYIMSQKRYGRVCVRQFDGTHLPYADNLVNLLVLSDRFSIDKEEIDRVLCPGGVAMFLEGNDVSGMTKTVKPWPKDIDDWSHWRHGPDANPVAQDRVVDTPRHVQWVDTPRWQTHHNTTPSLNAMVSSGGRMFYIVNEAEAGVRGLPGRWRLVARDAFNGVLLWKRKVPEWGWKQWSHGQMAGRFNKPIHLSRRLVADEDRVYVTLGFNAPVAALDAATGKTLKTYTQTKHASEIVLKDEVLWLSVNQGKQEPGHVAKKPPVKKHVMAVEADSGDTLWETQDYVGARSSWDEKERITRLALTVGDKQAFFLDQDRIIAIDPDTGEETWRASRLAHPSIKAQFDYYYQNLCSLVYRDGVLLMAQPKPVKGHVPYTPVKCDLLAFSADSGEKLWRRECYNWGYASPPDIFVIDGRVWAHDASPYALVAFDLHNGAVEQEFPTTEALRSTHHHRCYRDKATERFILTARRGTEFLDVESGRNMLHHWVRGTCRLGVMPANGLLYVPPHPCVCYITAKLNGLYALAPAVGDAKSKEAETASVSTGSAAGRLTRGPAYDKVNVPNEQGGDAEDWPTYRHDARRSGGTTDSPPAELEKKWSIELAGRPTSTVAAEGKVFVASTDTHTVHALDAADGTPIWKYTAEARVDTPPTVYQGLVLFGAADGKVYCVRASDGALIWKFAAAPESRQIMDHGQLASAWPVHGNVLIAQGVAYVCAGRSSFLDRGIHMYALDPVTGKVLQQERLYSPRSETGEMVHCELPYDMPPEHSGALSDILVTDGKDVFLRHLRFNPDDLTEHELAAGAARIRKAQKYIKTRKGPKDRDYFGQHPGGGEQLISNSGLLDDSWFNQSFWSVGGKGHSRLLVFNSSTIHGVRCYQRTRRHARDTFVPGKKGYKLFAMDRNRGRELWAEHVPVRIRAMVRADQTLFAAGPPDVVPAEDPWAAFEGREGAKLCVFDADDGEQVAEYELQSSPILDGMIAANHNLYLSTRDGHVVCYGKQ